MIVTILVGFYLSVLVIDFRQGMRNSKMWDKIMYFCILTMGLALVLLHEFGIELGSPLTPFQYVVRALFKVG